MYHAVPTETPPAHRQRIVAYARDAGLKIIALHYLFLPGMSITADDAQIRSSTMDHARSAIDLAHDLGAAFVVFGAGFARSIPAGMAHPVGSARVVDALGAMAAHAETRGVTVCFEGLNRYETNIGRTLAECSSFVDKVKSSALKVLGDTFQMNIEEMSLAGAIEAAGARLAHFHLADSHRMAPGDGHVDFPAVLNALKKIGYQGFVSFEFFWIAPFLPHLQTFELCDNEVAKGIRYIRRIS
jgi:sugar phosphate isomerase/epimerase